MYPAGRKPAAHQTASPNGRTSLRKLVPINAHKMASFPQLLRDNRNYRHTWLGQVVSEVGDHFNTIAVFALALENTHSGLVVSAVMISRAIPMILAGPVAGVLLDRWDRKKIMFVSDSVRAVVAGGFIFAIDPANTWLLYPLSAALWFAAPFFTSGRTAMLPTITTKEELQTANSLTQTTRYFAVTVGTFLGGVSVAAWGYEWAFALNAFSFAFSALMISRLRLKKGHFRPERKALTESDVVRPWHEYKEGLRYLRATPLFLAIALGHVGWATGGGAAQILFGLFGEVVFDRGAAGIGMIWSSAGVGLLIGAAIAYSYASKLPFEKYKSVVVIAYVIHGTSYIIFSQMEQFWLALVFIAISRASSAVFVITNLGQLLRHVNDEFRGRVFSTIESMTWAMMILSLTAAGVASEFVSPRVIGAVAGLLSSLTAIGWGWAHWSGRLTEPELEGIDPSEVEVHREPRT